MAEHEQGSAVAPRPALAWAPPDPAALPPPLERAVEDFRSASAARRPLFEARSEPAGGADLVVRPVLAVGPEAPAGGRARRGRSSGATLAGSGGAALRDPALRDTAGPGSPTLQAVAPGVGLDGEALRRREFEALPASAIALVPAAADRPVEVLVGLGAPELVDADVLRAAGAAAARAAASARQVMVDLRGLPDVLDGAGGARSLAVAVQAFVEGYELASYRFDSLRSAGSTSGGAGSTSGSAGSAPGSAGSAPGSAGSAPGSAGSTSGSAGSSANGGARVVVVCEESGAAELGVERATAVSSAVRLARDLVNTPAGDCTPTAMAEVARRVAGAAGLGVAVLDASAAARAGLGGLLGVSRGSQQPPVLVRLTYEPELDAPPGGFRRVALVGKGITFDSGGLSLKTAEGMASMKTDMSGAAAVLATLASCRRLAVPAIVSGFLPLTENMPGGSAIKPGDVLRIRNGTTVEVLNTDAEGRLVLADALSLAVEESADEIVDLATLTGAQVVALGRHVAGLMGNDDELLARVEAAAGRAGEAVWRLPLPLAYRPDLDSTVADLKNIGKPGQAGALIAGLFLQSFVEDVAWAHLDIAGPARSEGDDGWLRPGGTGFGVRTLVQLLTDR